MKPREFHIWDFPEDKVRVLFRDHNDFISRAISYFGNRRKLGDFLKISPVEIYNWAKYNLHIPLKSIKLIVEEMKLDWINIEESISSYKGANTSTPITHPKLPIRESPAVLSIITHIICDGSVNKNGIPMYTNSSKMLIDDLDHLLKNTFGNFKSTSYFGSGINRNCYQYVFPKLLVELIEHLYRINFYRKKEIPLVVFDLPIEFSVAVVKAFADDEGSVDLNRRISFTQKDKEVLLFLAKLLKEKLRFNNLSEIKKKGNCYCFYIKSLEIEKYQEKIGFTHPKKKEVLRNIIQHRLRGFKNGQHGKHGKTREKLLKLLNDKVLSTYDLMKELKINKSNINMQIKKLSNQRFIVQHHKTGQNVFWTKRN